MAVYKLKSKEDIVALADKVPPLAVGDILVHKPFEFYILEGELKKVFTDIEIFPATIGTDIYTDYGYNTSVVTK